MSLKNCHGQSSFLYFVIARSESLVKIGITTDIHERLRTLRAGSPIPLSILGIVPGKRREELVWHQKWALLHSHGEWFKFTKELEQEITTCLRENNVIIQNNLEDDTSIYHHLSCYRVNGGKSHGTIANNAGHCASCNGDYCVGDKIARFYSFAHARS